MAYIVCIDGNIAAGKTTVLSEIEKKGYKVEGLSVSKEPTDVDKLSTLNVLYTGGVAESMTTLSAACLLIFSLLYTPCIAAIASIKRELGIKGAFVVVVWQCALAWIAALLVHLAGLLIGVM